MRRPARNRAERLRLAVAALPRRTRIAMLDGLERNRIIVGAYTDAHSGGICPMLAAHRNGGRTSVASFARAWDAFTGAAHPRLATRREVRALRSQLEMSLLRDEHELEPLRRATSAAPPLPSRLPAPGDRHRGRELAVRPRWAWLRPTRRYDDFKDLVAIAEEELAEHRAAELLGDEAHLERVASDR